MPKGLRLTQAPRADRTLLKLEAVAMRLGVSRSKVQRLIGAGELAVVHLGPKLLRVPLDAVTAYIAAHPPKTLKPKAPDWLREVENDEAREQATILMLAAQMPTSASLAFERQMDASRAVVFGDDMTQPVAWATEPVCECGHLFSRHASRSTGCTKCRCEAWREISVCPECGVVLNEVNSFCNLFPLVTFNHRLQCPQYLLASDCYVRCDGELKFHSLPEQS